MTDNPLAKDIFQIAIEITQTAQRDAFVTGACRGDEALFRKVAELLEAHYEKDSWLDPRRARAMRESPLTESLELAGSLPSVSVGAQIKPPWTRSGGLFVRRNHRDRARA